MMSANLQEVQEQEWETLLALIKSVLERLVKQHVLGKDDYWLLQENWGNFRHEIEIQSLELFKPHVVSLLQASLSGFPDWEISIGLDVASEFKGLPPMGVIVRNDEIIDGLQRQHLPKDFQDMAYEGRVRRP
jgi:hypothetical protein